MAGASSPGSRGSREGSSASEDDDFGVAMEGAGSSPESESHDDEDNDESESGSSSDDQGHQKQGGFFDLEASESGDNSESESESSDFVQHSSFPQFASLPVELQRHIWEAFCPQMVRPSVYRFTLLPNRGAGPPDVWEDAYLDDQTAAARALMSVNRETRKLVLAGLPDPLTIRDGRRIVRFNKERDIIYVGLSGTFTMSEGSGENMNIPGFSEQIRHVALDPDVFFSSVRLDFDSGNFWPNLETAYFVLDDYHCHGRHLWWSVSKGVNHYFTVNEEDHIGIAIISKSMYCWPDLKHHRDIAKTGIPLEDLKQIGEGDEELLRSGAGTGASIAEYAPKHGIEIWPMVIYQGKDSLHRFAELSSKVEAQVYEDSEGSHSNQDLESEENEYESEGIDDDSIDSPSDDDDDDDLAVLPMSDNISSPGDFSPTEGEIIAGGAYPMAQFSSPEAESATANDTDNSDDEAPTRASRQRKRRVVSSDSEDESDGPNPRKRPRIANRRANIVSDEEEDEDSEDIASRPQRPTQMRHEDSEDEDEDEDDEGVTGRPISLAERLQLHRANNPISVSDEESSSAAPSIRDYQDFQDDDQSDDIGDPGSDEEALSEDALIDGMAEESEDDDNDGW